MPNRYIGSSPCQEDIHLQSRWFIIASFHPEVDHQHIGSKDRACSPLAASGPRRASPLPGEWGELLETAGLMFWDKINHHKSCPPPKKKTPVWSFLLLQMIIRILQLAKYPLYPSMQPFSSLDAFNKDWSIRPSDLLSLDPRSTIIWIAPAERQGPLKSLWWTILKHG